MTTSNAFCKKIFAKMRKCLIFQCVDGTIIPCELCSLFVIDIQSQTAVTIRLSRTQSDSRRKPAVFAGKSRDGFLLLELTGAELLSSVSVPFRCFSPFFDLPGIKPACTKRKPKIPRKIITDRCLAVLPEQIFAQARQSVKGILLMYLQAL